MERAAKPAKTNVEARPPVARKSRKTDGSTGRQLEQRLTEAADTGEGIAPEDQEAVFEEFRQVGTAAKKVEGTGLGLAISRKFIELHGGRIWVKSQVGTGSTFAFTLPLSLDQRH
jgi:signal transduction histidine kinase